MKEYQNKWLVFFKDFIKNLENYERNLEIEEEIVEWLRINKTKIEKLDEIVKIGAKNIKKVNEIKLVLEENFKVNYVKIWRENMKVACYIDSPYKHHKNAT